MRIILVRHAESEGNADGRLQGHADFGLSDGGLAQAGALRDRLQAEGLQPTHVYSSPLRRSADTARIAVEPWPVPVVPWDDLKEHDIGIFSGLTWGEIETAFPDVASRFHETRDWDIVEKAESFEHRSARGRRVIDTVLSRHGNDDVIVLFTHGGILSHMVAALMGTDRAWGTSAQNTALFDFSIDLDHWSRDGPSRHNTWLWRVNRFNDASHLPVTPGPSRALRDLLDT